MGLPSAAAELRWLDVIAQTELVRRGAATPLELVDAAIERIERWNPALNAVVAATFEEARQLALSISPASGPLAGVPTLLKDIGAGRAGTPQYMGNRLLRDLDARCDATSPIIERFERAGLVTLGITNVPEFGLQGTTQPLAFGPTRNPWDLERSVGGSSGGAAAAVAAGLVPVAHGNDGGGSIRHPAAWCGVVGLKPSRGRTSLGTGTSRDLCEFAITRSVRDAAHLLDVAQGAAPGDLFHAPPPLRPYREEIGAEVPPLRVGLALDPGLPWVRVDQACSAAAIDAARFLESLGHRVDDASDPLLNEEFYERRRRLAAGKIATALANLASRVGRSIRPDDVEPFTWVFAELARSQSAVTHLLDEQWMQAWATAFAHRWTTRWDVLVTPATGILPPPLDAFVPPADDPLRIQPLTWSAACFAVPFNVTGQPAVTLPLFWTAEGLPVGVQFVAHFGREDLLLGVASALEMALPWSLRTPPMGSR